MTTKTNQEIVQSMFDAINEFKRNRVLAEQARQDGETSRAIFHEMKTYKAFDSLELFLRAISSNLRHDRSVRTTTDRLRAVNS